MVWEPSPVRKRRRLRHNLIMRSRRQRHRSVYRLITAGCVVLWLLAASYCTVEHVFAPDDHGSSGSQDSGHPIRAVAHSSHGSAERSYPGHDHHPDNAKARDHSPGHHDDRDSSCCSSLKATALTAKAASVGKPALFPISFFCALLQAYQPGERSPGELPGGQTENQKWVFTPEVCLGPAFRSHAPPLAV